VVRHRLVQRIVEAYDAHDRQAISNLNQDGGAGNDREQRES
jgi:phosphate starvation-inducible protein PhoH